MEALECFEMFSDLKPKLVTEGKFCTTHIELMKVSQLEGMFEPKSDMQTPTSNSICLTKVTIISKNTIGSGMSNLSMVNTTQMSVSRMKVCFISVKTY